MSDDEKNDIIGNAVQEYADASTHAIALTATLIESGHEFELFARQLITEPAKLVVSGQRVDGRFSGARYMVHPDRLDIAKVLEMAEDLRQTLIRVDNLEKQLTQLGIRPHH